MSILCLLITVNSEVSVFEPWWKQDLQSEILVLLPALGDRLSSRNAATAQMKLVKGNPGSAQIRQRKAESCTLISLISEDMNQFQCI